MTATLSRPACRLQHALLRACRADVEAFKPGNVAIGAPAHRMTATDFLRSADVIAAPLTDPQKPLGERIEAAVAATVAAVGCNTNLGIVLLLAPMAEAALRAGVAAHPASGSPAGSPTAADPCNSVASGDWRSHLPAVLSSTTVADGAAAARAILCAHPAGLGGAAEADVSAARAAPGTADAGFHHTLLEAMALAAHRDQIARQYVTGFATVLDMAARFSALLRAGASREDAVTLTYLQQLADEPDTHICRKLGADVAQEVSRRVAEAIASLDAPPRWKPAAVRQLTALHDHLVLRGINPGTTADLIVATVFATELDAMQNF